MASLGCTLFERITSEISRFKAMSSLELWISLGGTFISSAFRIKGSGPGHTSLKMSPFRSAHREPSWMRTSQPSSQPLPEDNCLARRCATVASRKVKNNSLCSAQRDWIGKLEAWRLSNPHAASIYWFALGFTEASGASCQVCMTLTLMHDPARVTRDVIFINTRIDRKGQATVGTQLSSRLDTYYRGLDQADRL